MSVWRKCWLWAAAATFAAFLWQLSVVQIRFGGDWTGLLYSGSLFELPEELNQSTFRHQGVDGYDAQFYRLAAHDPFDLKGYSRFMDNPSYRRKRAIVPLLAWSAAFGQQRWIDFTYFAVMAGALFLGAWLLARLAVSWSLHPAWGAAFLVFPATLNGVDRMLPDTPLLVAALAWLYFRPRRQALAWIALASALMTRELGVLVIAGAACFELYHRRWKQFGACALSAAPGLLWWVFVGLSPVPGTAPQPGSWLLRHPVYGFFERIAEPNPDPGFSWLRVPLDAAIMIALPAAAVAAVYLWWRNRGGELEWLALAAAPLVVFASHPSFLRDLFSYPRAYSLLAVPLALIALKTGRWWFALPCLLISARLLMVMAAEILGYAA